MRGKRAEGDRQNLALQAPLVGWFHLGHEETNQARNFLRLCNGDDSVDELGFGILRDGFSDEFFPGTSTVMTETRYLIFLAAMYRHMESTLLRKKGAILDPSRHSRQMQDQLRDVLAKSYGWKVGKGVIGISVKELDRYPSVIYWAALRTLGILRFSDGAENDYLRTLPRYHELMRADDNAGDPVAEVEPPPLNWDRKLDDTVTQAGVIDRQGRFPTGLTFDLTKAEACYLRDCYVGTDRAHFPDSGIDKSLLADLIQRRSKRPFKFPWDVKAPSHLEVSIDDARNFSGLARGATLQFYQLLMEARKKAGLPLPDADIEGWLRAWWDTARPHLLKWDETGFIARRARHVRTNREDAEFVRGWLARCRSVGSMQALLRDPEARRLVTRRELLCKKGKARLHNSEYLRNWNRVPSPTDSPYQLNFRAPIGEVFVRRIVTGLEL